MTVSSMLEDQLKRVGDALTCPGAIIVKDGKVLVGHRHYTPDKWKAISLWTVPGGRCDAGETLEVTLRRETVEETGITSMEIVSYIGDIPGAKEGDLVPLFHCTTDEEPTLMEPEKFSEWKWVPVTDFAKGEPSPFINEHAREAFVRFFEGMGK